MGRTRLIEVTHEVSDRRGPLALPGDVLLAQRSWVPRTGWRTCLAWSALGGRYRDGGAVVLAGLSYRLLDADEAVRAAQPSSTATPAVST